MTTNLLEPHSKGSTSSKPIVFLTGGLGNQLFQIAQAKFRYGQTQVELDWRIGRPKLSNSGMPEVADFELGEYFVFSQKTSRSDRFLKPSQPLRYVFNLYLRNSVSSNSKIVRKFTNFLCRALWPFVGLIYRREILVLDQEEKFSIAKRPCLVGYFQNPKWLNDPTIRYSLTQLKVDSEVTREFEKIAINEKPLCVHMRMTDYRFDKNIGMIGPKYFIQEIRRELKRSDYGRIWLFSDEPITALNSLQEFNSEIRLIENSLSSAETLQLMKLCGGFIISNSTFSWWGAYLSNANPENITAPYPWFQGQESPKRLLPDSWQKSNPWQ